MKNNIFGIIFASLGELPGYGSVAFLCGGYVAYTFKYSKKTIWKILLTIMSVVFFMGVVYFMGGAFVSINGFGALNYEAIHRDIIKYPAGFLLLAPFATFGFILVNKTENKDIIYAMVVLSVVLFISMLFCPLVKPLFHRPRFRYLVEGGYELYHPWYKPFKEYATFDNFGDNEAFVSFPSGHIGTTMGFVLSLYFLPLFVPKLKGKELLLMTIGFCYTLFLAFTRIFVAAHFLSDVSFSGLIVLLFCFIGVNIYDKIAIKKNIVME